MSNASGRQRHKYDTQPKTPRDIVLEDHGAWIAISAGGDGVLTAGPWMSRPFLRVIRGLTQDATRTRPHHRLPPARYAGRPQDAADVNLDGPRGDVESPADELVWQTLAQEGKDFHLAGSQVGRVHFRMLTGRCGR